MKRIVSVIAMGLFAFIMCGWLLPVNARAQEGVGFQTEISFPFTINNHLFNAGVYQFDFPRDPFLLAVHNLSTNKTYFLDVRPEASSSSGAHGRLSFRRDGDHSYVIAIHFSGTGDYSVPVRVNPPSHSKSLAGLSSGSSLNASR